MTQFDPRSTQTGLLQGRFLKSAEQTSSLLLTTVQQNIPGCVLLLPLPGFYLALGQFLFRRDSPSDDGQLFSGVLIHEITEAQPVQLIETGVVRSTHMGVWVIETHRNDVLVRLQSAKAGGAGASRVGNDAAPFGSTLAVFYF
jgi:hypothetical protein